MNLRNYNKGLVWNKCSEKILLWILNFVVLPRSWWRHQMETFSASLALCAGNSPGPVNSPHKGQWRGALMFSLICVWINGWVNNREAGDLKRHRGPYDVIVMWNTTEQCYEIYLMHIYVALLCFVATRIYDYGSDDKAGIMTRTNLWRTFGFFFLKKTYSE